MRWCGADDAEEPVDDKQTAGATSEASFTPQYLNI